MLLLMCPSMIQMSMHRHLHGSNVTRQYMVTIIISYLRNKEIALTQFVVQANAFMCLSRIISMFRGQETGAKSRVAYLVNMRRVKSSISHPSVYQSSDGRNLCSAA